jgi:hypothetical protein
MIIGYSRFAGFSDIQAHTADDGAGNAVITLPRRETMAAEHW